MENILINLFNIAEGTEATLNRLEFLINEWHLIEDSIEQNKIYQELQTLQLPIAEFERHNIKWNF